MALILTGFTSKIGKAILKKYIHEGKLVYCLGRKDESFAGEDIDMNLKKFFSLDFSSNSFELNLENIFNQINDQGIEHIIHAAANSGERQIIKNLEYKDINKLITINYLNSVWFMKKSCDLLSDKSLSQNKSFIYISTQLAKYMGPRLSIYSSSKAAMNNLCRSLSHEYGPNGVRINIISPGIVSDDPYDEKIKISNLNIPLSRLATPEDVVNAVDFINSQKSCYINGINLDVNGGR